jgi:predicted DNA-binding transcriptional regulator
MKKDTIIGTLMIAGSGLGVIIYGWLVFFSDWKMAVIQLSLFVVVLALLVFVGWIGYALTTAPPYERLKDIEYNPSASGDNPVEQNQRK